ncbi:hypothetical protein [Methylobacterium fujisawaense]|jgi:hypothetical protein
MNLLCRAQGCFRAGRDAAVSALGWVVDLTAAVKADRHATATLKEPTARPGSKRAAIKSAILLAHPVKG